MNDNPDTVINNQYETFSFKFFLRLKSTIDKASSDTDELKEARSELKITRSELEEVKKELRRKNIECKENEDELIKNKLELEQVGKKQIRNIIRFYYLVLVVFDKIVKKKLEQVGN